MKMQTFILPTSTLIAGIGIGWMLHGGLVERTFTQPSGYSRQPPADSREDRSGSTGHQFMTDRSVKTEVARQEEGGSVKPDDGHVFVPSVLLHELSLAAGRRKPGQELFSHDNRIEAALGITDREKAQIQTAWRSSLQQIRNLEAATKKAEQVNEWTVRITVPDLSSSIRPLGEAFRAEVGRTLGRDRSEAFWEAKQIDEAFSSAAGERSYEIASESVGDGNSRYRMTLAGPEGSRVWVGDVIPDELRHLAGSLQMEP